MKEEEATASRGIRLKGPIEIPSVVARYYCSINSGGRMTMTMMEREVTTVNPQYKRIEVLHYWLQCN